VKVNGKLDFGSRHGKPEAFSQSLTKGQRSDEEELEKAGPAGRDNYLQRMVGICGKERMGYAHLPVR